MVLEDGESTGISSKKNRWDVAQNEEELRTFEANRRSKCKAKLDSTKLYWQAHVSLLQSGYKESLQAHRIVSGLAKAHAMLAKTLDMESYNKLVQTDPLASSSTHSRTDSLSSSSNHSGTRKTSRSRSSSPSGSARRSRDMMISLNESTKRVQQLFRKNAFDLEKTVQPRILDLVDAAAEAMEELTGRGKSLIDCMEMTENKVIQAWEEYFASLCDAETNNTSNNAIVTTIPQKSPRRVSDLTTGLSVAAAAAAPLPISPVNVNSNNGNNINTRDRWLAEVNYTHALAQQKVTWELSLEALTELYTAAKNAECLRRINLREFCIVFLSQVKEAFSGTEGVQALALVDWVNKDTSEDMIRQDVHRAIAEQTAGSSEIQNSPKVEIAGKPDRITIADFYKDLFSAVSPIDSEHIKIAIVVEKIRQGETILPKPQLLFLVITSDNMVHLFNTPTNRNYHHVCTLKDSPETVLREILSAGSRRIARGVSSSARPELREYTIEPSWTVKMDRLSVVMNELENAVDITALSGSGASFDSLCLRTSSPRDQATLINALHQQDSRLSF